MLALTVEPAQIVVGILVGAVAFLLVWFLLGSAARQKQDRERAQRMRAVIQPGQQQGAGAVNPQSGGWIPDNVTKFGTRFAESRGFSERLDAELEAAGVSLRSGEFVVASALAALVFGVILGVLGLVGSFGILRGERWGSILTIAVRGIDGVLSVFGVLFAESASLRALAILSVVGAAVVIYLLLRRDAAPAATAG